MQRYSLICRTDFLVRQRRRVPLAHPVESATLKLNVDRTRVSTRRCIASLLIALLALNLPTDEYARARFRSLH